MRVDWCVSSWFRIKNTHSLTHWARDWRALALTRCVPMTEEELAERMDHHGRVIQAVIDAIIAVEDAEAREEGMLYAAEAAAVAAAEHDLF